MVMVADNKKNHTQMDSLPEFSDFPAVLLQGHKSLMLCSLVNDKNSLSRFRRELILDMDAILNQEKELSQWL